MSWGGLPQLLILGVMCGLAGVATTRLMYTMDERFHHLPVHRAVRPAIGGALLGLLGVVYVIVFGWWMVHQPKPIDFHNYPMPAFYGDGYGAVQPMLTPDFYADFYMRVGAGKLLALVIFLCVAKIVGTCLTLGSGGSGGIIAPSLFLGATTGALLTIFLKIFHIHAQFPDGYYAIIGMGAVLAAVVHAPLSSILILFEVTDQRNIILPAMLACITATGVARLIFPDSVYTLTLRRRGVRVGTGVDMSILRRITLEQVALEPVTSVPHASPVERLLQLTSDNGATDFAVLDEAGDFVGMVISDDVKTALFQRDAIPLLLAGDLVRDDLPCLRNTDDMASALETFARHEVARLPVCLAANPDRIIGLLSRRELMREYHRALQS